MKGINGFIEIDNQYTYDDLNRLTQADYLVGLLTENEQFTYDKLGNRETVNLRDGTDQDYAVNKLSHRYDIAPGINCQTQRKTKYMYRVPRRIIWIFVGGLVLLLGNGCSLPHWVAREVVSPDAIIPIVYNKGYNVDIFGFERATRFDAHRYEKIYKGLKDFGLVDRATVVVPGKITDQELLGVHTADWIAKTHDPKYVGQVLESGIISHLPRGLVEDRIAGPFRFQTKGTVLAARYALAHGVSATLGGGFAHTQAGRGEGFNLFADVPLAVKMLRQDSWKGRIFILDVDAHHGQGNASIFAMDKSVFVMDIYNSHIYPGRFERVDLAIELDHGATDEQYLKRLKNKLPQALSQFKPDLMIYIAGVDCCIKDRLGGLALTESGINARDRFVIDQCAKHNIPLCMTLSGGYWNGSHRPSVEMIKYAAEKLTK